MTIDNDFVHHLFLKNEVCVISTELNYDRHSLNSCSTSEFPYGSWKDSY